jgi:predicted porin
VPLGSAQLFANFFDGEDKRDGTSALKTDLSGFQLGARYNLSRRTYLYFVHGKNESDRSSYLIERTNTALGLVHTF